MIDKEILIHKRIDEMDYKEWICLFILFGLVVINILGIFGIIKPIAT